MRGRQRRLVAPLGLALGTALAVAHGAGPGDQAPVYPVAAVRAGLARDPAAWLGRTVRVRGIAARDSCRSWPPPPAGTPCREWRLGLFDADGAGSLPLALGASSPLPGLLRRLPLVGRQVPPP